MHRDTIPALEGAQVCIAWIYVEGIVVSNKGDGGESTSPGDAGMSGMCLWWLLGLGPTSSQ